MAGEVHSGAVRAGAGELQTGTSKNWHMARDRRLWRADILLRSASYEGQASQTPGAAPLRAVTGFATQTDLPAVAGSIRICLTSGCGSFWLKKDCSSFGVSPRYAFFRKFFLSSQKYSATRQMRIFRGSLNWIPKRTVKQNYASFSARSIAIFDQRSSLDGSFLTVVMSLSIISRRFLFVFARKSFR